MELRRSVIILLATVVVTLQTVLSQGTAIGISGSSNYVNVPYSAALNPSDNFTVEFWARADGGAGGYRSPLSSQITDTVANGYYFYAGDNDQWQAWLGSVGTYHVLQGDAVVIGAWTHLALTFSSGTVSFYVNGRLAASSSSVTFYRNQYSPFRIGALGDAPGTYNWNGKIDEVRVWNAVRTAAQIRSAMHAVVPFDETGLVACFDLDEGTGTTTTDITGGFTGTFVNSPSWVTSTVPLGSGTTTSSNSFTSGTASLGTVSLSTSDAFDNAVDLVATAIDAPSNVSPGDSLNDLNDRYWVINAFGTPGTFSTNLTFTVPSSFAENGAVGAYTLYRRSGNSDGAWTSAVSTASAKTSTSLTFNGITAFSQFAIGSTAPASPQSLVVSDSSYPSVTLYWNQHAESDLLKYRVYRSTSPGATTLVDSTSGAADTSITFTDMSLGVRYYVRVTAVDSTYYESPYSAEVNVEPGYSGPPGVPLGFAATDSAETSIGVVWNQNVDPDIVKYRIYVGTTSGPTTATDSTTAANDTSATVSGLVESTTYYLRVTAVDSSYQESGYSNEIVVVTGDYTPPSSPQTLVVTDSTSVSIALRWSKNGEPDVSKYRIYSAKTSSPTTLIDSTLSASDTTALIDGLDTDSLYYFRITGVDSTGNESAYSNEVFASSHRTFVTATTPARHGIGAAYAATIQVTFSDTMVTSFFVDTTSFLVRGEASGRHKGSFGFSSGNTVVTFTPNAPFLAGEQVSVVVSSNLEDTHSKKITPYVWNFTVGVKATIGRFGSSESYSLGNSPTDLAMGDVNGDGRPDFAVAQEYSHDFPVFTNNGTGTFTSNSDLTVASSQYPQSTSLADVNNDGYGDLSGGNAINGYDNPVYLWTNDGDGTFTYYAYHGMGTSGFPDAIASGDLDGDGDLDQAVAVAGNQYDMFGYLVVLLNGGTGTYSGAVYTTGSTPRGIAFDDLNNDGFLDIAVPNADANTLSIFLNKGNGTFANKVDYSAGSQPRAVDIGDIDGDGDADVVVGNGYSTLVSVFKNNGNGTLAAKVDYYSGDNIYGVRLGDVDGDGDLDLFAANKDGSSISRFFNNGTGTFSLQPTSHYVWAARRVILADVNADSVLDIVGMGGELRIHFGNAPDTFAPVLGSVSPTDGAAIQYAHQDLGLFFDEEMKGQAGKYVRVYNVADSLIEQMEGNDPRITYSVNDVTIDLNAAFTTGSYYVLIDSGAVTDLSGNPFNGFHNSTDWNFSVQIVPIDTAYAATGVTGTSANVSGVVYPQGHSVTVRFLYKVGNGAYTDSVLASPSSASGDSATSVSASLTGLTGLTTYRYVVAVQSEDHYVRSAQKTFTTANEAFGSAVTFNGTGYAITGDVVTNATEYVTIEAWVKWDGTSSGTVQPIASNGDPGADGYGVYLFTNNKLAVLISGKAWMISDSVLTAGEWTHVAMVVQDSITWSLYKNGQSLVLGNDPPTYAIAPYTNFYVGGQNSAYKYRGAIDEVRVSNVARYTSNFSPPGDPFTLDSNTIALYHFDEGSGTSAADSSGNGFDLTLNGGTGWTDQVNPLPVELVSVKAEYRSQNSEVRLLWNTASEVDNVGWEVERREVSRQYAGTGRSGPTWAKIGFVEGAGTSTSPCQYEFIDRPFAGVQRFAYRLRQVDRSGAAHYTQEVEVAIEVPRMFALQQNYPNPFNPSTTINYSLESDGLVTLKVYDLLGREVATLVDDHQLAGVSHEVTFDASRLSSGMYLARLSADGKYLLKRMLLVK